MRLLFPVIPAILMVGLVLPGLNDTGIVIADTSVRNNEVVSSMTEAGNSSAIAMIMIAWTTPCGEGGSNEL